MAKNKRIEQDADGTNTLSEDKPVDGALNFSDGTEADGGETPYGRYRRLRAKRTAKIEQYTKLLSNLGNQRQYPWTQEDREQTIKFMEGMLTIVVGSMSNTKKSKEALGI